LLIVASSPLKAESASAADDFYSNKTITVLVGGVAGGGYDLLARLMARHIGKHIPGHPSIIVKNVPGANGLMAANTLYHTSPRDGTEIGVIYRNLLLNAALPVPGARFQIADFHWIGSLASEVPISMSWKAAGVKSAADLRNSELIIGGMAGVDPETTPKLYNALIETKFKIVNGYKSPGDIALAMERGEVEGVGDWSWSGFKVQKADWLRTGAVHILLQGSRERLPELKDVPTTYEFIRNDLDRATMDLYFTQKIAARPVLTPPGVPGTRVAALQQAFIAMGRDAEFQHDAEKSRLLVELMDGESVQRVISTITSAPPEVLNRLNAAIYQ
jgi:tripartite-type tricarboxylate transporter receptor subunit TctC